MICQTTQKQYAGFSSLRSFTKVLPNLLIDDLTHFVSEHFTIPQTYQVGRQNQAIFGHEEENAQSPLATQLVLTQRYLGVRDCSTLLWQQPSH